MNGEDNDLQPVECIPGESPTLVVAGLGNELLRDDGFGVSVVRHLARQNTQHPGSRYLEVGTAVMDLVYEVVQAGRVLLVDAVAAGGAPGTLYCWKPAWYPAPGNPAGGTGPGNEENSPGPVGMHQVGILQAIRIFTPWAHPDILVLGAEPSILDYGIGLSPELVHSQDRALRLVRHLETHWPATDSELHEILQANP